MVEKSADSFQFVQLGDRVNFFFGPNFEDLVYLLASLEVALKGPVVVARNDNFMFVGQGLKEFIEFSVLFLS